MDWTDTLILEDAPSSAVSKRPSSAMDFTRVDVLPGVTLLRVSTTSRREMASALKLLREFRATSRRVVLCDTTQIMVGKQFGHEVVEDGAANLLVSCGISGREVGIGARDAGLDLASVVVCSKPLAGGQVIANRLVPGDTVLLLGMGSETCDVVTELIGKHLSRKSKVAA